MINQELQKRILSSIILIPLIFYFIIHGSFVLISFILICFLIACYEWHRITKKKTFKFYGFLFLIFSFYTFYELSLEFTLVIFVIVICIATDIGGYIFGKLFKGPKLTKLSPNKTYTGMIGAFFLSLICLAIIKNYIDYFNLSSHFFILTLVISSVSQIGDIIISYFKRLSKIKDTGKIIPGHGGLLDRIDGMIFTFPVVYIINLTEYLNV